MKSLFVAIPVLVALSSLVGCGGGGGSGTEGALPECPSAGTDLTYDNFGKAFFDSYCNSCHAANSSDRQGAPAKLTFDSQSEIAALAEEAYGEVDDGAMPPSTFGSQPTSDEVAKLGEWLGCGAP